MGEMTPGYTANRPVNAIPYVCAAAPGIRTTVDLPQIIPALGLRIENRNDRKSPGQGRPHHRRRPRAGTQPRAQAGGRRRRHRGLRPLPRPEVGRLRARHPRRPQADGGRGGGARPARPRHPGRRARPERAHRRGQQDHRHVRQAGHRLRQRGHRQLHARPRDGRLGRGRRHQPGRRDEHPARDAAGDERGRLGHRHRVVRRDDQGRYRRRAGRARLQLRQAAAHRLRQVGRRPRPRCRASGSTESTRPTATPVCCTTTASTPGSGPTWRTRPATTSCRRSPPCS